MSYDVTEFVYVLWTSRSRAEAARRLRISRVTFYKRLRSQAVQRAIEELSQSLQSLLTLRAAEMYETALQNLVDIAQSAQDPLVRIEACREIIKHCQIQEAWYISE